MPRQVKRRYAPFFNVLKGIAVDVEQPIPLRVRSCELCIALLMDTPEIACDKTAAKVVRSITSQDDINARLLELSGLLRTIGQRTARVEAAVETPEAIQARKQTRAIDSILALADKERQKNEYQQN